MNGAETEYNTHPRILLPTSPQPPTRAQLGRGEGLGVATGLKEGQKGSDLTRFCARSVLSSSGRCSSNANTMQLAMMVRSTAYSKGVRLS